MSSYKNMFSSEHSKLLVSALLLAATSSLFACSAPDTNISNSAQAAAANQPSLLSNVSATVYKDANCGCCKEWIDHAEGHGLSATANDVANLALFKNRYGVPNDMRSCHTTVTTDGYVFEGHVPAKHIAQFLANLPSDAIGLAVPGMPVGSPGMEYQDQFMPYQVMQINKDGTTTVYATIETIQQQI